MNVEQLNATQVNSSLLNGQNISPEFQNLFRTPEVATREIFIIFCYTAIVLVSVFGNLLVCNVVFQNRYLRSTTYVFIANLAVSDLMMTILNIPFSVARILLSKWPFGAFMCSFVPLIQVASVYVSTFTMMCIALDRYQVITKPLKPRMGSLHAVVIMAAMWALAFLLSLPHAIFNEIVGVFTFRPLVRCRTTYPENAIHLRKWITLFTFLTQYVLPLSITGAVYAIITMKVWSRNILGVVTEAQMITQLKAKRKTIKMLVVVVILFALCWLPLNLYHVVNDFANTPDYHRSSVFFVCHWLAMSSVCYNPFIYCWLNDGFRAGARDCFMCVYKIGQKMNASLQMKNEFQQCNSSSLHSESRQFSHLTSTTSSTSRHKLSSIKTTQQTSPHESFACQRGFRRRGIFVANHPPFAKCKVTSVKCESYKHSKHFFRPICRPASLQEVFSHEDFLQSSIRKCSSWEL